MSSGYVSRDGPMPMRVWIVNVIAWLAVLFVLHAFGIYTVNFSDSVVTSKFIVIAIGVALLLTGGIGAWNAGYENVNTKSQAGKGVGYFFLYILLGYLAYVFLVSLGLDPTVTYLATLWNTFILHLWMLIIEVVYGYIAIYLVW